MSVFIHDPIVFSHCIFKQGAIVVFTFNTINRENFKQDLVLIEQFATL